MMKKANALILSILTICLFSSANVFAWADLGHETVAMVAQRYLTPEAKQGILDILGPEDLAIGAIWPDAVRNDPDFDGFKAYHYIEVPTGQSYQSMATRPEKDAFTVIHSYPDLLKDPSKSRTEKIIALRYLVHVIGDVHQPFHVGNGIDMGGNLCNVYMEAGQKIYVNIHLAWDERLVEMDAREHAATHIPAIKYYSYANFADDILTNNPMTAQQISQIQAADYFQWFKESADLRPQIYPDNPVDEKSRVYCKLVTKVEVIDPVTHQTTIVDKVVDGNYDQNKLPILSDDYKTNSKKIIETQLIKGGLRLAAVLNNIFAGTKPGVSKADILKVMQLVNPKEVRTSALF